MISSIPIAIFFIPYAIFLIMFAVILFFNLHHLKIYAVKRINAQFLGSFFLFGVFVILGTSAIVFSRYDWTTSIQLDDLAAPFMNQSVIKPF